MLTIGKYAISLGLLLEWLFLASQTSFRPEFV